jgi:anaphase-promoting complex subunit 5
MKEPLRNMLALSAAAPRQAHLVQFFDAWKAGDYTTAFDTLHRYFDYAMQARDRIHYQYALLHMAILQADFGCFGEAIAAINETIATARENQDIVCLNFSLNWLHHMSKAYPKQMKRAGYMGMLGSEREGLAFLKAKARETKTYNLLSASLINEAKLCLFTVRTLGVDSLQHILRCPGRSRFPCIRASLPIVPPEFEGECWELWCSHALSVGPLLAPGDHVFDGRIL